MIGRRPDEDEEYQDWEYPDPEDVEDLSRLPSEYGSSISDGIRMPILLKIFGGLMILAFALSLFLPVLDPLVGSNDQNDASLTNVTLEEEMYRDWIGNNVGMALSGYDSAGQVRFIGVEFGNSIQDPVVGILSQGIDIRSNAGKNTIQSYSITVFESIFTDMRAQSVTLAWLVPVADSGISEQIREIVLVVGMLRQTADGIRWASMGPADLRYVADYYEEHSPNPNNEESLHAIEILNEVHVHI